MFDTNSFYNRFILAFGTPNDVITELVDTTNLEGVLMDSYLLTYYHEVIKREPVRVKQVFEQPVNYGLVMAPNSTNFTDCFTRYVQNYPQEIFKSIRDNYKPLKVTWKMLSRWLSYWRGLTVISSTLREGLENHARSYKRWMLQYMF